MDDYSDIDHITDEIDLLDERINDAKKAADKAKGAIEIYMKQLKTDHDLNSKEEYVVFIEEGELRLSEINEEIRNDFDDLMEKCGDGF